MLNAILVAAAKVSNGFALVGVIVTVVAFMYRTRLNHRLKLIQTLKPDKREAYVARELRRYRMDFKASSASQEEQTRIATDKIEGNRRIISSSVIPVSVIVTLLSLGVIGANFAGLIGLKLSLTEQIRSGRQCVAMLQMPNDCLDNLARRAPYTVHYDTKDNGFGVSGHICNSNNDTTATYFNANPSENTISLWGTLFHFDQDGKLRYLKDPSVTGVLSCTNER
jgi:hypothetical protein